MICSWVYTGIIEIEGNIKHDLVLPTHFINKKITYGKINDMDCLRYCNLVVTKNKRQWPHWNMISKLTVVNYFVIVVEKGEAIIIEVVIILKFSPLVLCEPTGK